MKPFCLLFTLALLTLPCATSAQTITFTPGNKFTTSPELFKGRYGFTGHVNTGITSAGTRFYWFSPLSINPPHFFYDRNIYLEGNGELTAKPITFTVEGKAAPAFDFALFNGKLYAFAQVKESSEVALIYAIPLSLSDFSAQGDAVQVFKCEGFFVNEKKIMGFDPEEGLAGAPKFIVSRNGKHLLIYANSRTVSPAETVGQGKVFLKLFSTDLTNVVYDDSFWGPRSDINRFVAEEVMVSDDGEILIGGWAGVTMDQSKELEINYPSNRCIITVGKEVKTKWLRLPEGSAKTSSATFGPGGRIICAGTYGNKNGLTQGTFYLSYSVEGSSPDLLTQTAYTVEGKTLFYMAYTVEIDSTGNAWLISGDMGSRLVTLYDSEGNVKTQKIIYHNELTVHYALHEGSLLFVFPDDAANSCTANKPRGRTKSSNRIVAVKLAPDGTVTKSCIAELKEGDVCPAPFSSSCEMGSGKYVLVSREGEKGAYHAGVFEIK